jgi:hypothetical protein
MNDLDPIIDPEVLTAANRRHDADFSYTCGRDYCKCMQ